MFSGLVQDLCQVASKNGTKISILGPKKKFQLGESISVNGVCLTVTKSQKKAQKTELWFDLSPETLQKTNLKSLKKGDLANFERALTLQDLLGGHLVQGHVDGLGRIEKILKQGENREIWIKGPKDILRYVVPKGSVTVNGVSLTAVKVTSTSFSVALIPLTLKKTNLGQMKVGDSVNLEADIMAKYVERFTKHVR